MGAAGVDWHAGAIVSKSPEEFRKFWVSEHKRWAKVVTDAGAVSC